MREPKTPAPAIPGFTYERGLGSGGFADVYLYRQNRPARTVAIKVLRVDDVPEEMLGAFDLEADLMARISHPYIVTIHQADQAPDGRPYLVMAYYPNGNYAQKAKEARLDAPAVLRLGIQLAGAVETAHRAGIVHRDIKPANILINEFDNPGLTDFGIAGSRTGETVEDSLGMSIPYTAPEVIERISQGDEVSDVYSLTATLYTLVACRTPFEVTGQQSSSLDMARRILKGGPPATGAPVPDSLEHLFAAGLARSKQHRPQTARDLGLRLLSIEAELGYRRTDLIISQSLATPAWQRPVDDDEEDGTRGAPIRVIDPTGSLQRAAPFQAEEPIDVATGTVPRPDARPGGDLIRTPVSSPPSGRRPSVPAPVYDAPLAANGTLSTPDSAPVKFRPKRAPHTHAASRRVVVVAVSAAVVVLGAMGAARVLERPTDQGADLASQDEVIEEEPGRLLQRPERPEALELVREGTTVTVSWEGQPEASGYHVVRYSADGEPIDATSVEGTQAMLDLTPDGTLCVEVQSAIGAQRSAPTPRRCL